MYAVISSRKQIMFFKNLPLNFFFAETTILRLKVNCKTSFVVILNDICVLALNIRVNTLKELCHEIQPN